VNNIVTMARALVPQWTCVCELQVRPVGGVWVDGSGSTSCWNNVPHVGRLRQERP
jgi:hypothetical protein